MILDLRNSMDAQWAWLTVDRNTFLQDRGAFRYEVAMEILQTHGDLLPIDVAQTGQDFAERILLETQAGQGALYAYTAESLFQQVKRCSDGRIEYVCKE